MNSNNRQWTRRKFISGGLAALPLLLIPQQLPALLVKEQFVHRTAFAMGTTVSIQAYGKDRKQIIHAMSDAFDALYRFDRLFSVYDHNSTISRINRSAGIASVIVEPEVIALLERAKYFSDITNGTFDCTLEPLMRLWGFRQVERSTMPTDREINAALASVGSNSIVLDKRMMTAGLVRTGASIDLGGIAVGFTVDTMTDILRNEGITSALINHSGDLYAIGTPPESSGWEVGIPSAHRSEAFIEHLSLRDQALSTSGSSEKFVELDEKHFGHILDLQSGKPADEHHSLSVLASTSLEADVLSTTLFCQTDPFNVIDKFGTKLDLYVVDKQMNRLHTKTSK